MIARPINPMEINNIGILTPYTHTLINSTKVINMVIRKHFDKAAKEINKMTGATNLAKYMGEGFAKRKNPAVTRTVTGKEALKSAGKTALSIGSLLSVGGVARVASKAKKVGATVQGNTSAYIKRTYSGHEREGYRQAAVRNAARRKK